MKTSIIVAMDSKRGIGKDDKIPWHIREDLIHLKSLTKDHVVILGRKTYESMTWYYDQSGRPMPGKLYIVITRDTEYKPTRENAVAASSLEDALGKAKDEEVFINGGGQIFKEALEKNLVGRLYLTVVEGDFDADTFFPDYSSFNKVISEETIQSGEYQLKFLTLEK
jgi:dihydrofolate reductase